MRHDPPRTSRMGASDIARTRGRPFRARPASRPGLPWRLDERATATRHPSTVVVRGQSRRVAPPPPNNALTHAGENRGSLRGHEARASRTSGKLGHHLGLASHTPDSTGPPRRASCALEVPRSWRALTRTWRVHARNRPVENMTPPVVSREGENERIPCRSLRRLWRG